MDTTAIRSVAPDYISNLKYALGIIIMPHKDNIVQTQIGDLFRAK